MRVYIVILNWNGWRETIESLESVFRLRYENFVAVVCDNSSADCSLERISAWTKGDLHARETVFLSLNGAQSTVKPIPFVRLTRQEAEQGVQTETKLVLIDNGANLGFAGGCNVGIRFALRQGDADYVWVLNNDTAVDPGSLSALVEHCQQDPRIGICGSQIRFYSNPEMIQTQGGTLNPWFCTTHSLACGLKVSNAPQVPSQIDYIPGASMLVSRAYLEQVGLMEESYFLYFEEIDWAERGKRAFTFSICPTSIVYHHGGASIGTPREGGERGVRSEYFLLRNRLVFARRFYRARLITVYGGFLASILTRLGRGQWFRAYIALCALLGRDPTGGKMFASLAPGAEGARGGLKSFPD